MKKFLATLILLGFCIFCYAQNLTYSITAKSPVILYKNLTEIVNQLPPHAVHVKMSLAMGLGAIGAPNFEGIDPNANIAVCFFEPEDGEMIDLVALAIKTSENSLIYQLAAKECVIKRMGEWTVFQPKRAGLELDDNIAKLVVATAETPQEADLSVKLFSFSPLGLMPTDESRPNFKNMLDKEIGFIAYDLWLNKDMIKINFAIEIKSGSYCEKILKSLGRVDEIPEAKFVSKDNFITYESPLVATQETLNTVLEFFETYFKADKAELEKKLSAYVGRGHVALYVDGDLNSATFIKTPLTTDQYLEQSGYFSKLFGDIFKSAFLPSLNAAIDSESEQPKDKSETEIDSVKVTSFKENCDIYNLASGNGVFVRCVTPGDKTSNDANKFTSEVIKLVKADKAAKNPLPAKVEDMGVLTINPKEISEKEPREIFANVEPIVFKLNYKNSKLALDAEIATSNIVNSIAENFEIKAREAEAMIEKAHQEKAKAEEAEAQPQNNPE